MFKLGVENDLGISYRWYGFGVERSKVKVRVGLRAIRRAFELYECLLVRISFTGVIGFDMHLACIHDSDIQTRVTWGHVIIIKPVWFWFMIHASMMSMILNCKSLRTSHMRLEGINWETDWHDAFWRLGCKGWWLQLQLLPVPFIFWSD